MRHGIALERGEWSGADELRPLSEDGKARTAQVVKALQKSGRLKAAVIWSSPLVRAHQTAEIAAKILGLDVELSAALVPGADAQGLALEFAARKRPQNLLVVGHEPDCGELVAELTGDRTGENAFKKAGVALLEGNLEPGGMKLLWHVAPKDVLG